MSYFLLLGFGIWFVATLAIRVEGQFFFNPNSLETLLLTFALAVPLIATLTYPIRRVAPSERPIAAVYMVLPGMLLDVFSVVFFPLVFPNLPPTAVQPFSAFLLWGYGLMLLTGFIPKLTALDISRTKASTAATHGH